jgi:hypothetical protein
MESDTFSRCLPFKTGIRAGCEGGEGGEKVMAQSAGHT